MAITETNPPDDAIGEFVRADAKRLGIPIPVYLEFMQIRGMCNNGMLDGRGVYQLSVMLGTLAVYQISKSGDPIRDEAVNRIALYVQDILGHGQLTDELFSLRTLH